MKMVSHGTFKWKVESETGEIRDGLSVGTRRPFPRREYKDCIKGFSRNNKTVRIRIWADCEQARDAAMNIYHEQTRAFGMRPVWHRINDKEAEGWTVRVSEPHMLELLQQMSYQDKQEAWSQKMLAKYGVRPAKWYAPATPIKHGDRHITNSRPKSVLVSRRRRM